MTAGQRRARGMPMADYRASDGRCEERRIAHDCRDLVESPGCLRFRDDVWRHEVEHVAERPQQQPAIEKRLGQTGTDLIEIPAGRPGRAIDHQFDDADAAQDAHVADHRQRAQPIEATGQPALELTDPREAAGLVEKIEAGDRDRARQRIGRERVAVKKRPRPILAQKRVVDRLGRQRGARAACTRR